MDIHFIEKQLELEKAGTPYCIATLLQIRGHAPQKNGAKILIHPSGIAAGTIGGGKLEATVIKQAFSLMNNFHYNSNLRVQWNLQKDIGMSCGGAVEILFETFNVMTWNITVMGAGHIAQELVPLLVKLKAKVFCVDPRNEWLEKLRKIANNFSNLELITEKKHEDIVKRLPENTYFALMTQGHQTDLPILITLLKLASMPPFVGVIGSKVKAMKIKKELELEGIEKVRIDKLHCPLGENIGNSNSPFEIAISIVAQLVSTKNNSIKEEIASSKQPDERAISPSNHGRVTEEYLNLNHYY